MTKHVVGLLIGLLATGSGIAAQNAAGGPITVVGCVARAVNNGSLSGSPGVPPASPNAAPTLANSSEPTGLLVLNNAVIQGVAKAADASDGAGRPRSFELNGSTAELERQVGHRVEVSGTLRMSARGTSAAVKTPVDRIEVASMRVVAANCDEEPSRR